MEHDRSPADEQGADSGGSATPPAPEVSLAEWEPRFAAWLDAQVAGDSAHDREHIHRVVANAKKLAVTEHADLAVVVPAAWLHDCIHVPKNSPQRSHASRMAAEAAVAFLQDANYPPQYLHAVAHAIAAHSFSANIKPRTPEARVVQDADRLDSLGAVGLARCLMLGGEQRRRLYDSAEPFASTRLLDDNANTVDHFFTKLLTLAEQMQTSAGKAEARRRTAFLRSFIEQLKSEIS